MTNEYYDAVASYKAAMAQAKALVLRGPLTPKDSCSIYRENDWINTPFRGNMSPERMVV